MRDDSWTDRDHRANRLRKEREVKIAFVLVALAERSVDAFLARANEHNADRDEALKWLIAAATKKLEG